MCSIRFKSEVLEAAAAWLVDYEAPSTNALAESRPNARLGLGATPPKAASTPQHQGLERLASRSKKRRPDPTDSSDDEEEGKSRFARLTKGRSSQLRVGGLREKELRATKRKKRT